MPEENKAPSIIRRRREAGKVSQSAVSRTFSGASVSAQTREKIMRHDDELELSVTSARGSFRNNPTLSGWLWKSQTRSSGITTSYVSWRRRASGYCLSIGRAEGGGDSRSPLRGAIAC